MEKDHAYIGACMICQNEEGQLLLMQRSANDKAFPNYWGLVGGFMEWNETGEEAIRREAMEEIGAEIQVSHFIGRIYYTPHPYCGMVISLCYYTSIKSGIPYPAQPEECQDVKWFDPEELKTMDLAFDHKKILEDEKLIK